MPPCVSYKESLFLYINKTQRPQQRLCIQNTEGDTASLTDRFLTRDETGKGVGQGRALCAEEDGEGQVDLLGSGLQDPSPVISSLAVRCCPVQQLKDSSLWVSQAAGRRPFFTL